MYWTFSTTAARQPSFYASQIWLRRQPVSQFNSLHKSTKAIVIDDREWLVVNDDHPCYQLVNFHRPRVIEILLRVAALKCCVNWRLCVRLLPVLACCQLDRRMVFQRRRCAHHPRRLRLSATQHGHAAVLTDNVRRVGRTDTKVIPHGTLLSPLTACC